jgi:hypothetical protein
VHGGEVIAQERVKNLSDIYILDLTDLDQLVWKRLFILDSPAARSLHAFAQISAQFILYGGKLLRS